MIHHLRQKCDEGTFMPCLPSMKSSNLQIQVILNKYARQESLDGFPALRIVFTSKVIVNSFRTISNCY